MRLFFLADCFNGEANRLQIYAQPFGFANLVSKIFCRGKSRPGGARLLPG